MSEYYNKTEYVYYNSYFFAARASKLTLGDCKTFCNSVSFYYQQPILSVSATCLCMNVTEEEVRRVQPDAISKLTWLKGSIYSKICQ